MIAVLPILERNCAPENVRQLQREPNFYSFLWVSLSARDHAGSPRLGQQLPVLPIPRQPPSFTSRPISERLPAPPRLTFKNKEIHLYDTGDNDQNQESNVDSTQLSHL